MLGDMTAVKVTTAQNQNTFWINKGEWEKNNPHEIDLWITFLWLANLKQYKVIFSSL